MMYVCMCACIHIHARNDAKKLIFNCGYILHAYTYILRDVCMHVCSACMHIYMYFDACGYTNQ